MVPSPAATRSPLKVSKYNSLGSTGMGCVPSRGAEGGDASKLGEGGVQTVAKRGEARIFLGAYSTEELHMFSLPKFELTLCGEEYSWHPSTGNEPRRGRNRIVRQYTLKTVKKKRIKKSNILSQTFSPSKKLLHWIPNVSPDLKEESSTANRKGFIS